MIVPTAFPVTVAVKVVVSGADPDAGLMLKFTPSDWLLVTAIEALCACCGVAVPCSIITFGWNVPDVP